MTDEEMAHYSAALDEIYRLRTALAYEASVVDVHLGYKTFPKSRRFFAEQQVERMREAARGDADSHRHLAPPTLGHARRAAGMDGLTRHQWESR